MQTCWSTTTGAVYMCVVVSILYYSLHHQVQGAHSKAPRALHLLSRLAGPNRDVRVSEAAHVGQVSNLCIQTMTQLDDDICIRGGSVCVVGNGSQLHSDFTCYLYDEPYSGFISSPIPSYFYLILKSNVCHLFINIMFCYIFICWKIGGLSIWSRAREKDGYFVARINIKIGMWVFREQNSMGLAWTGSGPISL